MVPCGLVSPVVGTMLRVSSQYLFEEDKRREGEREKGKSVRNRMREGRKKGKSKGEG